MENDSDHENMTEANHPNPTIDASAAIEMLDLCDSDDEMEEIVIAASALTLKAK